MGDAPLTSAAGGAASSQGASALDLRPTSELQGGQQEQQDQREEEQEEQQEQRQPLVTPRELQGWYAFAFASEPISAVAISGFFPLLIQELALAAAGFPAVCPNIAPAALAAAAFPGTPNATAYFFSGVPPAFLPSAACVALPNGSAATLCPGLPANAEECLTAAGRAAAPYPLRTPPVAGVAWEPTAYATMLVSVATALQLVLFTSLGSLADYGALRFRILQALSALCAGLALLALAVGPADFQGAGCLFVLLGVAYGSTFVQYNGFLPLLAANGAGVRGAARGAPRAAARAAAMNRISSHGYGWGYVGAVIVLVACVGITLGASSAVAAYRASVALSGAWLAALGWLPFCFMRLRPGPPLPRGANHCTLPWGEVLATLRTAHRLPNTFALLAAWFFYADGMNLIGNIGAQCVGVGAAPPLPRAPPPNALPYAPTGPSHTRAHTHATQHTGTPTSTWTGARCPRAWAWRACCCWCPSLPRQATFSGRGWRRATAGRRGRWWR